MSQKTARIAATTRLYRKLHRWIAIPLFLFLTLIGATGLLLGWKKQVGLLPKTEKGSKIEAHSWVSLDSISKVAMAYATHTLKKSPLIDRIDVRPQKGVAKIVFADHFTELQIDCATGHILAVNARNSDLIEKIHDGSILDFEFNPDGEQFKLSYTSIAGLAMILLAISGFWLWYNPIRMKKIKNTKV
ncbi:MAG: PepSY domain-containing protein [Haliscomenobacter sp.]|nr:PepSY-associated TM helix domain-containing protein [Haliscomenobacter sp.]MBK9490942.1 PepSY domain-containing protein [Haliscomenobacter sp.]